MSKTLPVPDYDSQWKTLFKSLPKYVILRFFPTLYLLIDWTKGVRFLDKELQKVLPDFGKKRNPHGGRADGIPLESRGKRLVLVHLEAQHIFDILLPERMFTTFYRLKDWFPGVHITALALYSGEDVPKVFDRYEYEFEGVKLTYIFNALLVKEQQEESLLNSDNPIDLALLAGLYVLKSKNDIQKAGDYKRKLARLCFERGYSKKAIRVLLNFVSFLIALPEQESRKFVNELNKLIMEPQAALIDTMPYASQPAQRMLFGGKLFEEVVREREKEKLKLAVWRFHLSGVLPKTIANAMEIPLPVVHGLIKAYTENPPKPKVRKRKPQGWDPDEFWFESMKDYKAYMKEKKAEKIESSQS